MQEAIKDCTGELNTGMFYILNETTACILFYPFFNVPSYLTRQDTINKTTPA